MGKQNERKPRCTGLIDQVFSWSLKDVHNQALYKDKVCYNYIFLSLIFFAN